MLDRFLNALSAALALGVAALLVAANWPAPPVETRTNVSSGHESAPAPLVAEAPFRPDRREVIVGKPVAPEAPLPPAVAPAWEEAAGSAVEPPVAAEPLPIRGDALPDSVEPLAVPNHPQERNLNCEFRSASDLAAFYGYRLRWESLFLAVGHDPNGDPDVGFVGQSIDDPPGGIYPAGYGVHAAPIARGLRRMGLHATAVEGRGSDWLRAQLAAGRPVIIWATAGLMPSKVVEWETKDGRWVQGVPSQHTFTAIGYDAQGLWLNDPWDGSTRHYAWERFETAWALLRQQAVVADPTYP